MVLQGLLGLRVKQEPMVLMVLRDLRELPGQMELSDPRELLVLLVIQV